jgi:SAM-dependent methyltransferase
MYRHDRLGYEIWGLSGPYERYGGRWSRKVASEFLDWLDVPPQRDWGDVGCGTGALVDAILAKFDPKSLAAIDLAEGYITELRGRIHDPRVRFDVGDATSLPWPSASSDATVAGLVLNFVSDPAAMAREMARVTRPGGKVAAYLWDYPRGMQMMQHFWDVAFKLDPNHSILDRAERHPLSQPEPLGALFKAAGLKLVSVRIIRFRPCSATSTTIGGPFSEAGAAPPILRPWTPATAVESDDALKARLTPGGKGSISTTARAWAVRGTV